MSNPLAFIAFGAALSVVMACGPCQPDPAGSGGADAGAELICDEHPELAQIESIPCSTDADCPIGTACAPLVCGPAGGCAFGSLVPDGTACELGGACVSRRCCHDGAVVP